MLYPKNQSPALDDALFRAPTSEYRATPFWAWNGKLKDDTLRMQIEMMKKMGGAQAMLSMLPGAGKLKVNESDIDEKKIEHTKAIILSMTMQERENPSIIDSKRKRRIAAGSGRTVQEVNQLLKQFEQTKMLMKHLKGNKGRMRLPF